MIAVSGSSYVVRTYGLKSTLNARVPLTTMSDEQTDKARRVVVVGAGPVGCLAAISFAKMGWNVDIYEARPGRVSICVLGTNWFLLL